MKLNRYTKNLVKEFAKRGVKATFFENFSARRQDSLWYGGEVLLLEKGDKTTTIVANGEVRAYIGDDHMVDKNHCGEFRWFAIDHGIKTDAQMRKAEASGKLVFDLNNWFEAFYENDDYDVVECDICDVEGMLCYLER